LYFYTSQDVAAARAESRQLKLELAASEAERSRLTARTRQLETSNRLLRAQLAETTRSFRSALETAQSFLAQGEPLGLALPCFSA
jgi:hypothetical protein